MHRFIPACLAVLLLSLAPASAAPVLIYTGNENGQAWTTDSYEKFTRLVYFIFDPGTAQYVRIGVDRKTKGVAQETRPFQGFTSPDGANFGAASRQIINSSQSSASESKSYNFRSLTKPALRPISDTASTRTGSSLAYNGSYFIAAGSLGLYSATVRFEPKLTFAANNAGESLASATERVKTYLRSKKIIN